MSDGQVSAQGLIDGLFLDKVTIDKIKKIIMAIDPDKIKAIMDGLETDADGWLHVKIDLSVKV
jgi:hypothetical protein